MCPAPAPLPVPTGFERGGFFRGASHPPAGDGDRTRKNVADVLVLEGEARSVLDETCDRCMTRFSREKVVPLQFLLAETLENEEEDDIVLLENGEVDVGQLAYTAFILNMDTKHLCSEDCKGLCPGCGVNLNVEPAGVRSRPIPDGPLSSSYLIKTE